MNLSWKILLFVLFVSTIFISGMTTEYKFHLAGEVTGLNKELIKVGTGQQEIIDFNQKLRETDVSKEPCFNAKLPDNARKLLR